MVRGRRENPEAAPSRQLQISRAFRQRRAQDLQVLKDRLDQLETENEQLRADKRLLSQQVWNCKGSNFDPNGFPTEQQQVCGRCTGLQLEIDRLRDDARQFMVKLEPHVQAPLPATASGPSCSTLAAETRGCGSSTSGCGPQRAPSTGTPSHSSTAVTPAAPSQNDPSTDALTRQATATSSVMATPTSSSTMSPEDTRRLSSATSASYDARRVWEESVRSHGGDPAACCSGFFTCDTDGNVVVPLPPNM